MTSGPIPSPPMTAMRCGPAGRSSAAMDGESTGRSLPQRQPAPTVGSWRVSTVEPFSAGRARLSSGHWPETRRRGAHRRTPRRNRIGGPCAPSSRSILTSHTSPRSCWHRRPRSFATRSSATAGRSTSTPPTTSSRTSTSLHEWPPASTSKRDPIRSRSRPAPRWAWASCTGGLISGPATRSTTEHDFYSTHEALRRAAQRTGATVSRTRLYDHPSAADAGEIVERIVDRITRRTRVVAITWVHSGTGVKLPIRQIADAVAEHNERSADNRPVLLFVDGLHGFGVEDETVASLGCDVFVSGTHKWLWGPRGTGIVWANAGAWNSIRGPTPPFEQRAFEGWLNETSRGPHRAGWPTRPVATSTSSTAWPCRRRSSFTRSSARRRSWSAPTSRRRSSRRASPRSTASR